MLDLNLGTMMDMQNLVGFAGGKHLFVRTVLAIHVAGNTGTV